MVLSEDDKKQGKEVNHINLSVAKLGLCVHKAYINVTGPNPTQYIINLSLTIMTPPCVKNSMSEIEYVDQENPMNYTTMHLHTDQKSISNKWYMPILVVNYLCLFVGSVSSSILSKYYFIHKGSSKWVSTWVQTLGFPLLMIPISLPYVFKFTKRTPFSDFTTKMWIMCISTGVMLGFNNLLFSWGNSYLPVSTSALLLSSQLIFNLIFSVIIVKQKITFSNLNCVFLLTLSSILLALDSSNDRPRGVAQKDYLIGFLCTIGAGLMFALYLPVMERVYEKVQCYGMVMEMQIVMEASATALATVGMAWEGGFSKLKEESQTVFDEGSKVYWVTVMGNVVTWQLCFMGTAGMVFLTCSLTGGICMTALLSMNVLGGVVVFRDNFGSFKAVSTLLCIWGFFSYVYGIYKFTNNNNNNNNNHSFIENNNNNNNNNHSSIETIQIVRRRLDY